MSVLMCPVCRQTLNLAKSWQCEKGHHYDVAKQGYVNLYMWYSINTVKHLGIRQSRYWRAEKVGFYQPLQQVIVELLQQFKARYHSGYWLW